MPEVVGVQFIKGGLVHYYYPLKGEQALQLHDYCVVETEHGIHLAKVVHPSKKIDKNHLPEKMKTIMRQATTKDKDQFKNNLVKEKDAYKLCRQKAIEKKLAMKLVDVSYSLDARKAVFYFTAENRVDFRELVKELAHALKVKIEMRQIGVRDEARRLGGVGCCGRTLCCCTFLKDFVSVSIRMAKEQNLSLNPTKVSGLCGRLMCCLSYEYEGKGKGRKTSKKSDVLESDKPEDITKAESDVNETACNCDQSCDKECTLKETGVDPGASPLPATAQVEEKPADNKQQEPRQQQPTGRPGAGQESQQQRRNKKNKKRPHHNKHRRFKNKNKPKQQGGDGNKPASSGQ